MKTLLQNPKKKDLRKKTNKFDILSSKSKSSKNFFYSSIANRFIIQRRLEKTLREVEEFQVPRVLKLEKEIEVLFLKISKYRCEKKGAAKDVHNIVGLKKLHTQLEKLQEKLHEVKNQKNLVRAKYKEIKHYGTLDTLVMANNLDKVAPKKYNVDVEFCTYCGVTYVFQCQTYLNVCPLCCDVRYSAFNYEEHAQEIVSNKIYAKNSSVEQEKSPGPKENSSAVNAVCQKDSLIHNHEQKFCQKIDASTNRLSLFKKYLAQFLDTAPAIDQEVFLLLYNQISHIHLHSTVRCKPTPVTTVLKKSRFKHLSGYSVKIARMFDGLDVPVINQQMMDEMVDRYSVLINIPIEKLYQEKLYSFEFVASIIFFAMGEFEMCKIIQQNKNKKFFNFESDTVQHIARCASVYHKKYSWARINDQEENPVTVEKTSHIMDD